MLQRNLLYTGVTRGKKLVVLVGQESPCYCRPQRVGAAAMVEAAGVADEKPSFWADRPAHEPALRENLLSFAATKSRHVGDERS